VLRPKGLSLLGVWGLLANGSLSDFACEDEESRGDELATGASQAIPRVLAHLLAALLPRA